MGPGNGRWRGEEWAKGFALNLYLFAALQYLNCLGGQSHLVPSLSAEHAEAAGMQVRMYQAQ
jgi:hypothetical protein